MANQITGKILTISPPQQVAAKDGSKTFVKRSLVLDCTRFDPYTGERSFENTPLLEFFDERCQDLDRFQTGQVVTVSFDVRGTRYRNRDGVEQIFTRLSPYRIELHQRSRQAVELQPFAQVCTPQQPQQAWQPQPAAQQTYATAQQAQPAAQQQTRYAFPTEVNEYGEPPF